MLVHGFFATALLCGYHKVPIRYQTNHSCAASVLFYTKAAHDPVRKLFRAARASHTQNDQYPADRKPQGNRLETRSADQPVV